MRVKNSNNENFGKKVFSGKYIHPFESKIENRQM